MWILRSTQNIRSANKKDYFRYELISKIKEKNGIYSVLFLKKIMGS